MGLSEMGRECRCTGSDEKNRIPLDLTRTGASITWMVGKWAIVSSRNTRSCNSASRHSLNVSKQPQNDPLLPVDLIPRNPASVTIEHAMPSGEQRCKIESSNRWPF